MSGRSAYVRAKKTELAEQKSNKERMKEREDEEAISGLSVVRPSGPTAVTYIPNGAAFHPEAFMQHRRQSSSDRGSYIHQSHHARHPPRPPVITTSAIEKSHLRAQLDEGSTKFRSTLGKFLGAKTEDTTPMEPLRPATGNESSGSDSRGHSFGRPASTSLSNSSGKSPANDIGFGFGSGAIPVIGQQQLKTTAAQVRKFEPHIMVSGKAPDQGYHSRGDKEMWFEDGDTLVYFTQAGQRVKPGPSMRIHSKYIFRAGSEYFMRQLEENRVPYTPHHPRVGSPRVTTPDESSMGFATSKHSHGAKQQDFGSPSSHVRPRKVSKKSSMQSYKGVDYEIYAPWPGPDSKTDPILWHLTTRNFFAMLCNVDTIWGNTFFQAFIWIRNRVHRCHDYLPKGSDRDKWIVNYLARKQFHDVRNNPSYAAGLLALSEQLKWKEGYVEAFVHCAGMLKLGLQQIPEYRNITLNSSVCIEVGSRDSLSRVQKAQTPLLYFDLSIMWPRASAPPPAAKGAFDRCGKWFLKFYENEYGRWPPTHEHTWLNRDLIQRLSADFHMLYEFFVDRDVHFVPTSGPGFTRSHTMKSKSGKYFRADSSDLSFQDILLSFDQRNGYPHIPHPYPLVPQSVPVVTTTTTTKSSFPKLRSKKPLTSVQSEDLQRAKGLSYTQASNLYTLRDEYQGPAGDFVRQFLEFEEADGIRQIDPYDARRGRWILIYGILQTLAEINVDSPNLLFKEGVSYFLDPIMRGVVPWADPKSPPEPQREHDQSYCWKAPALWDAADEVKPVAKPAPRVVNLPVGPTQRSDTPTQETVRGNRQNGESYRSGSSSVYTNTVNPRSTAHRSNSSALYSSMPGIAGSSRQTASLTPRPAVESEVDGRTWVDEEEVRRGMSEVPMVREPVNRRRRAEEWIATDGNSLSAGYAEAASDAIDPGYQTEAEMSTQYSVRNTYDNSGHEAVIVGVGVADGSPSPSGRLSHLSRRRRLHVHGVSTYDAQQSW